MISLDGQFYFHVKEAAAFFDRSPQWIHYGEKHDYWPGLQFRRDNKRARLITSADIENMAWMLTLNDRMSTEQAQVVLDKLEAYLGAKR